jgi:hypothetical protein
MKPLESNTGIGDRLGRLMLSLPLAIVIAYYALFPLFFVPFYLVVTGITGISLEYWFRDMLLSKSENNHKQATSKSKAHLAHH